MPSPGAAIQLVLRLESVALALAGLAAFVWTGGQWWLFLLLLLVPDVSALGYVAGPRVGAVTYNLAHNLVLPLAMLGLGAWSDVTWLLLAGGVLLAHVGMDRALGYGMKLPSGFKDTHLGRIGR